MKVASVIVVNLQNVRYIPITKGNINAIANAIRVGTINTGQYFFNVFFSINAVYK